jgi:hypothetical protein
MTKYIQAKHSRKSLIGALLLVVAGLALLNWGAVVFGLLTLGSGVYLTYRALPKKIG